MQDPRYTDVFPGGKTAEVAAKAAGTAYRLMAAGREAHPQPCDAKEHLRGALPVG